MRRVTLELICWRVCDNLRTVMGSEGCSALLDRAIARTVGKHPVLRQVRGPDAGPHLEGVAASVEARGLSEVAAAVDALFAEMRDVLTRLIGEEMALRLMEVEIPPSDAAEAEEQTE